MTDMRLDTPRVAEAIANLCDGGDDRFGGMVELAQQLERELAEANRRIAKRQTWVAVQGTKPERRWIGEDLPRASIDVLTISTNGEYAAAYYDYADRAWYGNLGFALNITHWMPLPEAPK